MKCKKDQILNFQINKKKSTPFKPTQGYRAFSVPLEFYKQMFPLLDRGICTNAKKSLTKNTVYPL